MSAMIDSPVRYVNRHRTHSLRPTPGRDAPAAAAAPESAAESATDTASGADPTPVWTAEEAWDGRAWDEEPAAEQPVPAPVAGAVPALGPRPAALPCDGLAVPARRTVALFPPIRAGVGRHRLPRAVRRRPGPIAAGLMVAATTLAAGSLRLSAPLPAHSAASTGHQCAPLLPGEPCE